MSGRTLAACRRLILLSCICFEIQANNESIPINSDSYSDATVTQVEDNLVVTATRDSVSPYQLPYSIHLMDEQTLAQRQIRSLPEALSETPGVMVQKTANGQGSPFIRGFTGYRTLSLIDGVRYNNSVYRDGPNEYFSLIDFNSLSNLELLSGPASVLYGSDAIGGTLNLKTKASDFQTRPGDQFFIHGSQSNRLASAESSHLSRTELDMGSAQSWGVRLGASFKGFGDIDAADSGTLPTTGYDEYAYDVRFDVLLNRHWRATLVHQMLNQDDVWRTHSTIYSKSFAGTTIGSDQRRVKDQNRSLNYVKLTGDSFNQYFIDSAQLTLSYQTWNENGDRIRSNGDRNLEYFDSGMYGIDLQFSSDTRYAHLIYGIDYYQDNVDSGRTDLNPDGSIDQIRIQGPIGDDATYSLFGSYLQAEFFINDRFTVTAGTRLTYTRAEIGRFEDPNTGLATSYEDSWTSHTNSIRGTYSLNSLDTMKLWAGISQSFRAPNIADLSRFGASRSNETEIAATGLDPEKFLTYEIGFKSDLAKLNLTGSYYYTDIRDFITSTPTGSIVGGLTEVSKQNSSSGFVQGIEFTASHLFNNGIQAYGNITWLEGELDVFNTTASMTSTTEPISRLMPLTSTVGLRWQNQDETLWFDMAMTMAAKADKLSSGDRNDTQRIPPGGTPAYTLVNVRAGKLFNPYLSINLAVNNLFDEAYRVHGSGTNEPGLNAIIGLQLSF